MLIHDYRTSNTIPLSDLEPGDVFKYDNCFYLVTTDEITGSKYAAVNLETGEIRLFDVTVQIEYLDNASVSIRD
jgi:hypothetical protein